MMKRYLNRNGDSDIKCYESDKDFITVGFFIPNSQEMSCYQYTDLTAGAHHVAAMKRLAEMGSGLGSYIGTHKPEFIKKWRQTVVV